MRPVFGARAEGMCAKPDHIGCRFVYLVDLNPLLECV